MQEALMGRSYLGETSNKSLNTLIDANAGEVDQHLKLMQEHYGAEKLEKLSPKELYELFKQFSASRQVSV
jgi:hypothetical protein